MYETDAKLYIFDEVEEEKVQSLFFLDIVYLKTILICLAYVETSTANKVNGYFVFLLCLSSSCFFLKQSADVI